MFARLWPELARRLRLSVGNLHRVKCRAGTRSLPGPRPQRRLPSVELFPAVALVLAGHDQGRLSRAREYRRGIRPRGALGWIRNARSFGRVAQDLREARAQSRLYAVQCFLAGSLRVSILLFKRRPYF